MERHGNAIPARKLRAVKARLLAKKKPGWIAGRLKVGVTTVYGIRKKMREAGEL